MGLSSAMLWWEEWQLRILVLASLFVQWLLFLTATLRKYVIPSWFRSIIWLAYLGSDALAIYALATLFNRQKRQDCSSGQGNSILEVVWAPVLLIHLGGQEVITAYNIEDNELWTRNVLTAVSQVTVAIYVFCKSWPGSDKRLWQAAILLFVPGILKCLEKPWALKNASINSLVSSSTPALKRTTTREGEINSLQDYVQKIRDFVQAGHCRQALREDNAVDLEADHEPRAQGEAAAPGLESNQHPQTSSARRSPLNQIQENVRSPRDQENLEDYKLFLDLASPYPDRIGILKSFWGLEEKQSYALLQNRLFSVFDLLYTKRKMHISFEMKQDPSISGLLSEWMRFTVTFLPWVAIGLFHNSHREAYNDNDVKVTYVLFCCTAVLEFYSIGLMRQIIVTQKFSDGSLSRMPKRKATLLLRIKPFSSLYEKSKAITTQWIQAMPIRLQWPCSKEIDDAMNSHDLIGRLLEIFTGNEVLKSSSVGQYTLVGFFARNRRHTRKMCIVNFFNCKDFLDQHWSMNPCNSSFAVTELVLKYVKKGWEDQMYDADSYWKFNNCRGQWTLQGVQANMCDNNLCCSLRRPFDESILLWHIATDFCFCYMDVSADHHRCATTAQCIQDASGEGHGCAIWCERSPYHERAVQCREMSNYMVYLLFVNPEMLLAGTRRNLFITANTEIEEILKDDKPSLDKILKTKRPKKWMEGIERGLVQRIISKVQRKECREQVVEHAGSPPDAERSATTREGFVPDAWKISEVLLALGDEKMWEVIEGVWVEMLCFSASRCRGYLHAKSLGTGPELLTYVWLLLSHMGMETLPERLQRTELSCGGGNSVTTTSTSQISRMERPTRSSHLRPHEEAAADDGASTSESQEILPAE